jgi:hypothetical protein
MFIDKVNRLINRRESHSGDEIDNNVQVNGHGEDNPLTKPGRSKTHLPCEEPTY